MHFCCCTIQTTESRRQTDTAAPESATEWYGRTRARTRFFVLIAALAVDEDKRAQRHAAPIALVEGQDCAVVIGVLAPDIFRKSKNPNAF